MEWTDDPINTNTIIKIIHFEELRNQLDTLSDVCIANNSGANNTNFLPDHVDHNAPFESSYRTQDDPDQNVGAHDTEYSGDDSTHYTGNYSSLRNAKNDSNLSPNNTSDMSSAQGAVEYSHYGDYNVSDYKGVCHNQYCTQHDPYRSSLCSYEDGTDHSGYHSGYHYSQHGSNFSDHDASHYFSHPE